MVVFRVLMHVLTAKIKPLGFWERKIKKSSRNLKKIS
jgi:hypothetical protein